jgi:hypothetical protein
MFKVLKEAREDRWRKNYQEDRVQTVILGEYLWQAVNFI